MRPSAIIDIIRSGESFVLDKKTKGNLKSMRELSSDSSKLTETETCKRCGYISSNDLCVSILPSSLFWGFNSCIQPTF